MAHDDGPSRQLPVDLGGSYTRIGPIQQRLLTPPSTYSHSHGLPYPPLPQSQLPSGDEFEFESLPLNASGVRDHTHSSAVTPSGPRFDDHTYNRESTPICPMRARLRDLSPDIPDIRESIHEENVNEAGHGPSSDLDLNGSGIGSSSTKEVHVQSSVAMNSLVCEILDASFGDGESNFLSSPITSASGPSGRDMDSAVASTNVKDNEHIHVVRDLRSSFEEEELKEEVEDVRPIGVTNADGLSPRLRNPSSRLILPMRKGYNAEQIALFSQLEEVERRLALAYEATVARKLDTR